MTDETKKLFDAPWKVRVCEKGNPEFESDLVAKKTGWLVGRDMEYKTAKRVARLPELYDALMHFVYKSCSSANIDRCPNQGTGWIGCRDCSLMPYIELLRKVRDGE